MAQLTIQGNQGATFTAKIAIEALDPAAMDALFTSIWGGMNAALIADDKATALTFLTPGAQEKYGPVFDALMSSMPDIVASYSALQRSSISPSIGEYAINRTIDARNRIFLIYFLKDFDGVWRIDAM